MNTKHLQNHIQYAFPTLEVIINPFQKLIEITGEASQFIKTHQLEEFKLRQALNLYDHELLEHVQVRIEYNYQNNTWDTSYTDWSDTDWFDTSNDKELNQITKIISQHVITNVKNYLNQKD